MLNEKEIINLLKESLKSYIKCLERNDFDFLKFEGQIISYLKVINRHDLNIRYLDIIKAKELLNRI